MFRSSLCQIVKKNNRSWRLPYNNSSLHRLNESRAWKKITDKQQSIRSFTNTSSQLTKTNIMEGEGDRQILNIDYDALLDAQKNNVLIIDVREQYEIDETGKLPGSIHIPMGNVTNLLNTLSDQAFQETFEKIKPKKDTKIVLSCRSGMRSGKVQQELQKLGYENVYNFNGGWLEWESKQKL